MPHLLVSIIFHLLFYIFYFAVYQINAVKHDFGTRYVTSLSFRIRHGMTIR